MPDTETLWLIVKDLYPHEAKHAEAVFETLRLKQQIAGLQEALGASQRASDRDRVSQYQKGPGIPQNGSQSLSEGVESERVES